MAEKLVSIVIVTRNRKEVTAECLVSVSAIDYPKFEIILVDNGSTDGTAAEIREKFPEVKLIEAKENLGLNGGKNLGQKQALGEYVFFLDSDTVVDKNILSELVKVAKSDPKIGIVCPKMYYFDQKDIIWYAGVKLDLFTSRTDNIGHDEKDKGQYDVISETLFAPTAYLVTRKAVDKLRGHEELFFMTYGDTDYGFRAIETGYKVMFCPKAKLWHRLGKDENTKSIRGLGFNLPMRAYYFARNRVVFMKRHAPRLNFLLFLFFFFPLMTIYFSYKIIAYGGGWKFLYPHLLGSLDGLRFAFGGRIENCWK